MKKNDYDLLKKQAGEILNIEYVGTTRIRTFRCKKCLCRGTDKQGIQHLGDWHHGDCAPVEVIRLEKIKHPLILKKPRKFWHFFSK